MSDGSATGKRQYRMAARATATAATREKILEAGGAAFDELPFDEITLAWIAQRAGVSVQTVLRHFESKDGLFLASLVNSAGTMAGNRDVRPIADVEEIVDVLVDHYEQFGDRVLRTLNQEDRVPMLHVLTDFGRTYHAEWCEKAFAPVLKGLRGKKRKRRLAQLIAGTDVYIWKLLRRDRGLSETETKLAMRELLEPLLEAPR